MGVDYVAFGKPSVYGKQLNLVHPELEEAEKYHAQIRWQIEKNKNQSQ